MERKIGPLELPFVLLLVLAVIYTVLTMNLIGEFKSLPSPLYGGDYYYQLGAITHLYRVPFTEWFGSSNGIGNHPAYFILYSALTTIFGKILGLAPMQAMFSFNLLLPLAALVATFFLFKKLFEDPWLALVGSIMLVSFFAFPILKYTEFTKFIVTPFFLYSLYSFFKNQDKRNTLLLGLSYGLMGISHSTAFIFASALIVFVFAYMLYADRKSFALTLNYAMSKQLLVAAFLIGFIISQLYWFEPIFVYHGQTQLASQLWSTDDYSNPIVQQSFLWNTLRALFFSFDSLDALVLTILTLAGFAYLFINRKALKEHELFAVIAFGVAFILTFSYFITMPLFGTNMVPDYIYGLYLTTARILIAVIGLVFVIGYIPGRRMLILAIIALSFLASIYLGYDAWHKGKFYFNPERTLEDNFPGANSLQAYLMEKTSPHDVILSSNEVSFALNAISGNNVLLSRRAHNDPFVDFDRYQMDGAIMFYGSDPQKRLALMKKYNVSYLYVDSVWLPTEWQFSKEGALVGYSDPILLFYSPQKEAELVLNGIKYKKTHGYVDPSVRGPNVKTYDLLIVTIDNYNINQNGMPLGKGIWNPGIDGSLTEVWSKFDSNRYAILYKVNYN
jgi:hypothetical protein